MMGSLGGVLVLFSNIGNGLVLADTTLKISILDRSEVKNRLSAPLPHTSPPVSPRGHLSLLRKQHYNN